MQYRYNQPIVVRILLLALVSTSVVTAATSVTSSTGAPSIGFSDSPIEQLDLTNRSETEAWFDETMATLGVRI